jgi:hypothetical protein
MQLEPAVSWKQFERGDEVVELISRTLELVENRGIWEYYNFTETTSFWCADLVADTNQVHLEFESTNDDAKIRSLKFDMNNNRGRHFKELFGLRRKLRAEFDILDS